MVTIYIDADACPVKNETYAVAKRFELLVYVVANQWMHMPDDPSIRLEVVDDDFDAADNWIVEQVHARDIVISDDIPLAARCIEKGALVLSNRGETRDENNIGEAMAMRELMQYMRDAGESKGGQKPMDERDRKKFKQRLDVLIHHAQQS